MSATSSKAAATQASGFTWSFRHEGPVEGLGAALSKVGSSLVDPRAQAQFEVAAGLITAEGSNVPTGAVVRVVARGDETVLPAGAPLNGSHPRALAVEFLVLRTS